MLRSLIQPESVLIKLCQSRDWSKVKTLVTSSPNEAQPTSANYRGISSTALVFAILNSAPIEIVKLLVKANPDQLMKVRHHRHGNALHESIKHKSSIDIIIFLINTIIKLENEPKGFHRGDLKPLKIELSSFPLSKKYKVVAPSQGVDSNNSVSSSQKYYVYSTLFNQTDHFGRTPLHYLVEIFTKESGESRMLVHAIQLLVQAFPPAVAKRDTDGLTPLDICLISPKVTNSLREIEVEIKVFSLAKMMVKACPSVALPVLNSAQASILCATDLFGMNECGGQSSNSSNIISHCRRIIKNSVDGNITHNTLSHALMHGRHSSTIELLINASKISNPSWHTGHIYDGSEFEMEPINEKYHSCMTIVTTDLEVPLHIAVTMRASPEVVAQVVNAGPDASIIRDRCGLTPICWCWMRFLIDEISKAERGANESFTWTQPVVKQSKRRFIPGSYLEVHDKLTNDLGKAVIESAGSSDINFLRRDLCVKLSYLLPHAAKAHAQSCTKLNRRIFRHVDKITKWTPVHAAALISCPRAILLTAIMNSPKDVKKPDELGNLPIHYAAASQFSYSKILPIGVTFTPQTIEERSKVFDLLPLYPASTKIMNSSKQLPLHIAIDSIKEDRKAMDDKQNSIGTNINKRLKAIETKESIEGSTWMYLVNSDIESLEKRDGITNLYPFMQAAVGDWASLDCIFLLLGKNPTLVKPRILSNKKYLL